MKLIKSLTLPLAAVALLATLTLARAEDKPAKKACCDATVAAEKNCDHKCCKKAAEEGKICKKCHPEAKKDDKKS